VTATITHRGSQRPEALVRLQPDVRPDPAAARASLDRLVEEQTRATTPDLTVRELRVRYGDQMAVHGVDIEVPAASCVAVLGANGAGKTSLLGAISGMNRPVEGEIRFAGLRIDQKPAHRIEKLGICHIPEGRGVFPNLTVAENLRLALGADDDRLGMALERFPRLQARLRQRAGTLSGGEQQMLAVAPAVVGEHRLLLFDELSLGLAPVIVDELFTHLAALRTAGTSMVIVEQFADRALELADHAYVLRKGRVAFSGAARELRGDARTLHQLYLGGG
jgi:branched-chain amino acid transport system ATP-binding protein